MIKNQRSLKTGVKGSFIILLLTMAGRMVGMCMIISSPSLAGTHSFTVQSLQADGEIISVASSYGKYRQVDKSFNQGALGGGTREYKYILGNTSPGKRGTRGAVDGQPDSGASVKGNTFTTTVLRDIMRFGQTYNSGIYQVYKTFFSFDTSAIPNDAIINSIELVFYGKSRHTEGNADFSLMSFRSLHTDPSLEP